jgi:hypothetical protein
VKPKERRALLPILVAKRAKASPPPPRPAPAPKVTSAPPPPVVPGTPEAEDQDDDLEIELRATGMAATAGDNVLKLEDEVYEALESDAVANWPSMSAEERKEAVKVALGNIKKKAAPEAAPNTG